MGLHDFTIYDAINRNARCFGKKPAWLEVTDGREITFGQLKDMVDHLAKGLQDAGLNKGEVIGVMGKNSLEYFLLFGAASALGLIVLPINWRLSPEEAGSNLADGGPRFVFADAEYQELIEGLKGRLSSVERYYNLSGGGRFQDLNGLLDNNADFTPVELSTDDGTVIIHTAAVEGKPRGALLSHGNFLAATTQFSYIFKILIIFFMDCNPYSNPYIIFL